MPNITFTNNLFLGLWSGAGEGGGGGGVDVSICQTMLKFVFLAVT